jgi:hypothetical protein
MSTHFSRNGFEKLSLLVAKVKLLRNRKVRNSCDDIELQLSGFEYYPSLRNLQKEILQKGLRTTLYVK